MIVVNILLSIVITVTLGIVFWLFVSIPLFIIITVVMVATVLLLYVHRPQSFDMVTPSRSMYIPEGTAYSPWFRGFWLARLQDHGLDS